MKRLIVLAAILPVSVFAQDASRNPDVIMKSFVVHYEKNLVLYNDNTWVENKKSKNKSTLPGAGTWRFGRDTCGARGQQLHSAPAATDWARGYATAEKVTLTCPAYPDLKADELVYDNNTNHVKLEGNIRLVDQGTEKYIGEVAYLDFSDDTYKITGLK